MYSKSPTFITTSFPPFLPPEASLPPPPPPPSSSPPQAARPTESASRAAATSANHFFVLMSPSFRIAYRGWGRGTSPAGPRVQRVLQAVAEQVEREHCDEQRQ